MTPRLHLHIETKIFIALALFAFVLLFIVSPDSYTHDLYGRHDTAWYFMCGKAWMEGLAPYVDFADSKGPLLWLIYGIGYLISPYNYIGVFWLSCLWYAGIYYATYLTAKIYLHDRRRSFICAILMSLAFFSPLFHRFIKAEEWCTLFMMLSLYQTSIILHTDNLTQRAINKAFFMLGACWGCLLFIKYNFAAMQLVFIAYSLYHILRNHFHLTQPLLILMAGVVVVTFPFVVYLMYRGCFSAFIHEYFLNSYYTTVGNQPIYKSYLMEWENVFLSWKRLILFIILFLGSCLYGLKAKRYKLFPLVSSLFIFAITTRHSVWDYYFNICAPCCIWILLFVILHFQVPLRKTILSIASLLTLVFLISCHLFLNDVMYHFMFWNDGKERADFYTTEYYISQIEKPSIINANYHEDGHGILSKSLPGAKYWSMQNGMTKEMCDKHYESIFSHQADFIIFNDKRGISPSKRINSARLLSSGYPFCYNNLVYSKKMLSSPVTPIHVSNWEVLTKQRPKALRGQYK